jgi:hypothetical protein
MDILVSKPESKLDELLAEREKINTRIQGILDSRGNQPRDIFQIITIWCACRRAWQ